MERKKGFTLTELIVIMAIISILSAMAVPTMGRQLEMAREQGDAITLYNYYCEKLAEASADASRGDLLNSGEYTATVTAGTFKSHGSWDYSSPSVEGIGFPAVTKETTSVTFTFVKQPDKSIKCTRITDSTT